MNDLATSITVTATGLGTEPKLEEENALRAVTTTKQPRKSSTKHPNNHRKHLRHSKAKASNAANAGKKVSSLRKKPFQSQESGFVGLRIESQPSKLLNRKFSREQDVPSTLRATPLNHTENNNQLSNNGDGRGN